MTPLKRLLTGSTSLSDWSHVPRDPGTIGAWILNSLGASVAATSFTAMAVGYLATTLVSSWAMSLLAPKPSLGSGAQGTLVNAREAVAPHEYVYGTVARAGPSPTLRPLVAAMNFCI